MLDRDGVLLSIARCPVVYPSLSAGSGHPCKTIVEFQGAVGPDQFRLPEPWRGDIVNAPLLFVSSNPSWSEDDNSPMGNASQQELIQHYCEPGFPQEFPHNRRHDGTSSPRAVQFWASIRKRAAELYGRDCGEVCAGRDFAITEIVHCKSQKEKGVAEAADECIRRHFSAILQLSKARVVVILGRSARDKLNIDMHENPRRREWHGRERWLACLPHPNAHTPRTFTTTTWESKDIILELRNALTTPDS